MDSKRIRNFTEKGLELFHVARDRYNVELSDVKANIDRDIHYAYSVVNQDLLLDVKDSINKNFEEYQELSDRFIRYLETFNNEESSRELQAHSLLLNSVKNKVDLVINYIENFCRDTQLQDGKQDDSQDANDKKSVHSDGSHKSRQSQLSRASNVSSILIRQKAKTEAARAKLRFAKKEAELERQQAELSARRKVLEHEKDLASAEAELFAVQDVLDNTERLLELNTRSSARGSCSKQSVLNSLPDKEELIDKFIDQQSQAESIHNEDIPVGSINNGPAQPRSGFEDMSKLNANAPSFVPTQSNELVRLFLRKDLICLKFTNFNDDPSSYHAWKNGFKAAAQELMASPREELDLLVKWLVPGSSRHAMSLRAANSDYPERGLYEVWSRLDNRYGSPEVIESSVRKKLVQFGKLKDNKELFDLSHFLSEILALKHSNRYGSVLSYFDSSSGVNPVVEKLSPFLQNKWTDRAARYKREHCVPFPPFSFFVHFVQDMCTTLNDPSFVFSSCEAATLASESRQFKPTEKHSSRFSQSKVLVHKTDLQTSTDETKKPVPYCPIHKANHSLNKCRGFKRLPLRERKEILYKNKICFRCCDSNAHCAKDCTKELKCQECGSNKHPSGLHISFKGEETPNANSSNPSTTNTSFNKKDGTNHGEERISEHVNSKCLQVCGSMMGSRSCAKTLLVNVFSKGHRENTIHAYAILDDQSNKTLAKGELLDRLNIQASVVSYTLSSCNGVNNTFGRMATSLVVESLDGETQFELPPVLECDNIPDSKEEVSTPNVALYHEHLSHLASSLPPYEADTPILLLIGRDVPEAFHVMDQCTGPKGLAFAQHLPLGWVIIGEVCIGNVHTSRQVNVNKTSILTNGRPTLFKKCNSKFDVRLSLQNSDSVNEKSDLGSSVFVKSKDDEKVGLSVEDRIFLRTMDQHFAKNENGNWTAPLPFKPSKQRLPNNKTLALHRARLLDNNLRRNPQKKEHFIKFMSEIFERGHAEPAPAIKEDQECWYLPIFGVYHPKKPSQLRGVFDSSAVFQGISLNKVLMSGPDMINNLVGVLLHFRQGRVAAIADIQKMFYCFYVNVEHRDFLRFYWYADNNPDNELMEFRMCVHVFGNSPSPAIANYGLHKTVEKAEFDVKDFVQHNFYVDDGLISMASAEHVISLLKRTQEVMKQEGNLRLHKIASNDEAVMKAFPPHDLASDLQDLEFGSLPLQRSLGLIWDLNVDCFKFKISDEDKPYTRRGLLSTINSIFDPLGFLSPITIQGKIILREIMSGSSDWDEKLPKEGMANWVSWKQSLLTLKSFSIPRAYFVNSVINTDSVYVFVYSDASERAIASVAYLVLQQEGGPVKSSFLFGKAKVAPSHCNTVPRLELCAAVLSVEIAEFVTENVNARFNKIIFFTDSKVVLGYIYNETRRFYTYVSNRVDRIRRFSDPSQWHYINTSKNPADLATRSSNGDNVLKLSGWISGPTLQHADIPCLSSATDFSLVDPDLDNEVRPIVCVTKSDLKTSCSLGCHRFSKFSNWRRLVKAIVHLKLFVRKHHSSLTEPKSYVQVYKEAERLIVSEAQRNLFAKELNCIREGKPLGKESPLRTLNPYIDQEGLLRIGGRLNRSNLSLNERNPVILHSKSHVAKLLAVYFHESVKHQGRHLTEGAVRTHGYWIIGAKRLVSSIIHACVKCRRFRGRPSDQLMADLPEERVSPGAPFSSVGVDTFGPYSVVARKTRGGHANFKRWALLFTCLTTRAVHIEVIEELSSSSFINALRRFIAIRGNVKLFRSDRGTNFIGAVEDLQIQGIRVEDGPVKHFLNGCGSEWIFNVPHAPHMGGIWERLIGITKKILDSMLLNFSGKLTHEVLITLMAEVSAIINSRQITTISADPDDPLVLSPALLLTQKSGENSLPCGDVSLADMYKSQWKRVQLLADEFWNKWRKQYLQTLQGRRRWLQPKENLKVGDIVLLKDQSVDRVSWPMGRIMQTFPSDDGFVRKVEVKVFKDQKSSTYVRPITEIVLLLSE